MANDLEFISRKDITLEELAPRFPEDWARVQEEVCRVLASRRPEKINAYVLQNKETASLWKTRLQRSGRNPRVMATAVPLLVRARLAHLAISKYLDAATKKQTGREDKARNSFIYNLFFKRYLSPRRSMSRPLPARIGKWLWPLVPQKDALLGQLYREGIYCAFTDDLVNGLSDLIGDKPALEIAAGDGALSHYLQARCRIRATDDQSWSHSITYPDHVENLDAASALKKYRPAVVLCCWPPADNRFERRVFRTPEVETYIVIGSRHSFATGDQTGYSKCKDAGFQRETASSLSRAIFPKEVDGEVIVFRRGSRKSP